MCVSSLQRRSGDFPDVAEFTAVLLLYVSSSLTCPKSFHTSTLILSAGPQRVLHLVPAPLFKSIWHRCPTHSQLVSQDFACHISCFMASYLPFPNPGIPFFCSVMSNSLFSWIQLECHLPREAFYTYPTLHSVPYSISNHVVLF